jgi:hypothetical protein
MLARTLQNLDLYLEMNHRQMKTMHAYYSVRMGYWALKNNLQEYKVYVIMIWIFDSNFMNNLRQAPRNNLWPVESTNNNYKTYLLRQA